MDLRRAVDQLIRRETRILAVLCAIAVVGFFATRALAAANRRTARDGAAQWHALGASRLAAGDFRGAVDAFRTASLADRADRNHQFALADALRRTGDNTAAHEVLLRLRNALPEDVEVNASLARLEAGEGNVEAAVRYYQTAILGLWQPASLDERRALRVELIEFLLDRGAPARALSEALKLSGEIPDDPAAHVEAGRLLLRSGSAARAEAQFIDALRVDPRNGAAIAGAGAAAFEAGDYERAREFLARADPGMLPHDLLPLVELVLADDPLLPHLTARDRGRRLVRTLDALAARAAGCAAAGEIREKLATLQTSMSSRRASSADSLGADLGQFARLARQMSEACPPAQPIDRAVLLIARRHGVEPR